MPTEKQKKQYASYRVGLEECLARLGKVEYFSSGKISMDRETYSGMKSKCRFIDSEFGVWWTTPANIIRGRQHPRGTVQRRKANNIEKYGHANPMHREDVKHRFYQTMMKKYGHRHALQVDGIMCKVIETIHKTQSGGSRFEKSVQEVVGKDFQKSYIGGARPIEIDLLKDTVGIECHGDYWHTEQILGERLYHRRKYEKCRENGVQLIQIFQSEWKKNQKGTENFLLSKTRPPRRRVFARKTALRPVSRAESESFCQENHIQGSARNYFLGLGVFLGEELLGVFQVGKGHRQQNAHQIFIRRMCFKSGVQVVGGVSKASTYLARQYGTIYTFVDLRFSWGEGYLKNGWNIVGEVKPDYWYLDISKNRKVSKQSRKKAATGIVDKTEKQAAEDDSLFRVWDAGKLKLSFSLEGEKQPSG